MNFEGSSSDESKRRRESGSEEEIVQKCKKTGRTPKKETQAGGETEEKLDKLMRMMQTIVGEVQLIRTEQQRGNEEFKKLSEENRKIRKENEKITKENEEMKKTIADLALRMDKLEKQGKRNNIVVSGLKIREEEPSKQETEIENFIKQELEVTVSVENVAKLGQTTWLVKLKNTEEKQKIMKSLEQVKKQER